MRSQQVAASPCVVCGARLVGQTLRHYISDYYTTLGKRISIRGWVCRDEDGHIAHTSDELKKAKKGEA